MAFLARTLSFVLLFAVVCAAQQQPASQQSSQVKLEDIERDSNQRGPQGSPQPGQGPQGAQEVPQLTPQQIAAFQQQYLVQPQQYFAPQFAYPEFQGVPLTYVPAAGNHLGAGNVQGGNVNVPQYQAYFVPQSPAFPHHVVPVVQHPGQVHPDAYRHQFVGQPQFIQHPGPQGAQVQGQVGPQQGTRTVSVVPPNNSVYRTIQPPFGANLIYTNPPQLPQQIIFTQPQSAQQFGINSFSQRPSKAQFSAGVKSTPATPTKSPEYNTYSQAQAAASSSSSVSASGSTSSNDQQQQYRFSG